MRGWPTDFVPFVRAQLPSLEALAAIKDPDDMGPTAEIPAVYVHILLSKIEALQAEARLADLTRLTPSRPHQIEECEWPCHALLCVAEATEAAETAGMGHVALPQLTMRTVLRYIEHIEGELGRIASPMNELARAAAVRAAAAAIVSNVEGFTGELDGATHAAYVRQAVCQINSLMRRLHASDRAG